MAYDKNSINKVILIGRLGSDVEVKYTASGIAVASVSLATTTAFKDGDQMREQVEWHKVVAWRKLAEILGQYAHKGSRIYVEGRLQTRTWEKDGQKHYSTEVVAATIQLLDGKPQAQEAGPVNDAAPAQERAPEVDTEDLPF